MFDKFGEFDSYIEINKAAEGQKAEGDLEALIALAVENGLDKEDAEDYMDGMMDELCNPLTAALGKISVESAVLQPKEIVVDWIEYIKAQCVDNPQVALKVRSKNKSINGCIAKLLEWSYKNCYEIPKDISDMAGIKGAKVKLGIPGMGRAKSIIDDYYMN